MRLLLDTQVWLWLQDAPERLPTGTLGLLSDPENARVLSIASCWEMAIKAATGKLRLPLPVGEFIPTRVETSATELLPIRLNHVLGVAELPTHHRDPFDRLLVVQSLTEGLPIVTADRLFARYGVELIPA